MLKNISDAISSILFNKFKLKLDGHTLEVLKKSSSSSFVKIIGLALSLFLSVFLGRTIGAEGLGIINLSNKIVTFCVVFGLFGAKQMIIKEVSIARQQKNFVRIKSIINSSFWFNGILSIVISLVFILSTPWVATNVFAKPELTYPLIIFFVVLVPQVFSRVFSSGLIGYKKIWQSNLVDQALSVFVTFVILIVSWLIGYELTVINVAYAYAIGRIVVTFSVGMYWRKIFTHHSEPNEILIRELQKKRYNFFLISISSVIFSNADIIIIGMVANTSEVGIYTVSSRLAMMTCFFLKVTNSSLSPKIAALYSSGKLKELELMIQRVTKGLFWIGLSTLILYIFIGRFILSVWGEEFKAGFWILIILSIGQFVNLTSGAVGLLLMMTNHEKIHSRITVSCSIIGLVLLVILVFWFDVLGAAIASSITVIGMNLLTLYFVKKKLNLSSISFNKNKNKI